ncbi:MAG: dinuclear metal center protein, YbgI/SA1388 family [Methanobacterium sp. Maddingley MBC34]|nr:MAG: dinuclear metal center protein, YbgI/SA1388 family [Methanobacterium sp. Maddingley MBC34]
MLASELFKCIEQEVPLKLALKDDPVGFIGPGHPEEIEVENALVVLDLIPGLLKETTEADLLVCHHPPLFTPTIPTYIIHSNWDIVQGGANDALAESLQLEVTDVLEPETGIGRICNTERLGNAKRTSSTEYNLDEFIRNVSKSIPVDNIRLVKGKNQNTLKKVAIISGFGLNPHYIKLTSEKGADLLLSGDLTHPGSILARKLGITLVDATHHATEVPGLIKLCQLIGKMGIKTDYLDTGKPWEHINCQNMRV